MVRKIKKKTLFLAGVVGLSLLSFLGMRGNSQDGSFTETDLRDLLAKTPVVHADVGPSPSGPDYGPADPSPCPSGPCGP